VRFIRHTTAIAVSSGVAVASLALPLSAAQGAAAPTAAAPTATSAAGPAAGYLARRLGGKNRDHYTASYVSGGKTHTYVNYGQTADAVLSMDAAGVAQAAAARATAFLEKEGAGYVVGSPTDYPGAAAKLLLVASAQHVNPTRFGSLNLVTAITDSEGAGDAATGEYQQNPGFPGSSSYIVSQALPIIALSATTYGVGQPDADAVAFLADQQCADGGFQSVIRDTPGTTACGSEDIDSTGYAIQALIAGGDRAAAATALTWLTKQEHANGSFGAPGNANSTALAVQALVLGHRGVSKPGAFLAKLQVGCAGTPASRGAIRFKAGKYDAASALLATSQAAAALALKPLAWIDRSGARASTPVLSCPTK
jgi:A-macroglobulin TED domain